MASAKRNLSDLGLVGCNNCIGFKFRIWDLIQVFGVETLGFKISFSEGLGCRTEVLLLLETAAFHSNPNLTR